MGCTPSAVDAVFGWLWAQGRAGDSVEALAPLARTLGIDDLATALAAPAVRDGLRANGDAAIAAGVFGSVVGMFIRGRSVMRSKSARSPPAISAKVAG
jgi:2-hydroxychromene-2-carboxylate isomerase